jgi:hypothetical protein
VKPGSGLIWFQPSDRYAGINGRGFGPFAMETDAMKSDRVIISPTLKYFRNFMLPSFLKYNIYYFDYWPLNDLTVRLLLLTSCAIPVRSSV